MCENWEYENLAKRLKKEAIVEMKHAEKLIEHILFLEWEFRRCSGPRKSRLEQR